jgi:hypothetical protein
MQESGFRSQGKNLRCSSSILNPVSENLEPFLMHDRIALDDNVFVGE